VDKNNQVILNQADSKKRKDAETSSVAVETEEKETSFSSTEPPAETSPKNEIDLTRASADVNHVVHSEKSEGSDDDSQISIMHPNDVIFESETKPGQTEPEKRKEKDISEKKRAYSWKSKTEKPVKEEGEERKRLKKKTVSKKTKSTPVKPMPQPVIMSKGIAYLSGNMIKLTGGIKLSPGDEIKIKDKDFVLKAQPRKKTVIYFSAAGLLILGLILFSPLFKSKGSGRLIGIVMDETSRVFVPQAKIYLKEADKTVKSNQLGFFMLESIPPGLYTLEASFSGYKVQRENVTITKDQSTTISVQLSSLSFGNLSSESASEVASPEEGSERLSSTEVSTSSDYGSIRIKSNVSDPMILIDDRTAGAGNKVYRKIEPGKHLVTATKEGYSDWAGQVTIKPGQTLNIDVELTEDKSSSPETWKDYLSLAESQRNSNDFTSALNSYDQALALNSNSPEALLGRGHTYMQIGEESKASEDWEKAGKLFFNVHDYQNAILCYNNLVTFKDKDAGYYLNRGVCFLQLGRYQNSIADLKKATELDAGLFLGYLNLGEAYCKTGEYKLSIETYKRARKLNPNSQHVFAGLTKAYYLKGDQSEAKKSYKKYEELSTYLDREKMKQDPDWSTVLKGMGVE
jgi:tetratricopeptide (TPR) repeat protein